MKETFRNERVRQAVNYLRAMGYIANSKDLAEKMHRSRSALSEIMSGSSSVSDKFIYELLQMFPELNKDYFYDERCDQMLIDGAEGQKIAQAIVASVMGTFQSKPNTAESNAELLALVENYAATIKYLQEHIKQLSDIILKLTSAMK